MSQLAALPPDAAETIGKIERLIAGRPLEYLFVVDLYGVVVAHFEGEKDRVKMSRPVTAMIRTFPMHFVTIHNHPRGMPPSGRDVHMALRRKVFESRVVTRDKVYRVQPLGRLEEAPSRLYECLARIEGRKGGHDQAWRLDRTLQLYASGSKELRLPALIRYAVEPLVIGNPRGSSCSLCDDETTHG